MAAVDENIRPMPPCPVGLPDAQGNMSALMTKEILEDYCESRNSVEELKGVTKTLTERVESLEAEQSRNTLLWELVEHIAQTHGKDFGGRRMSAPADAKKVIAKEEDTREVGTPHARSVIVRPAALNTLGVTRTIYHSGSSSHIGFRGTPTPFARPVSTRQTMPLIRTPHLAAPTPIGTASIGTTSVGTTQIGTIGTPLSTPIGAYSKNTQLLHFDTTPLSLSQGSMRVHVNPLLTPAPIPQLSATPIPQLSATPIPQLTPHPQLPAPHLQMTPTPHFMKPTLKQPVWEKPVTGPALTTSAQRGA